MADPGEKAVRVIIKTAPLVFRGMKGRGAVSLVEETPMSVMGDTKASGRHYKKKFHLQVTGFRVFPGVEKTADDPLYIYLMREKMNRAQVLSDWQLTDGKLVSTNPALRAAHDTTDSEILLLDSGLAGSIRGGGLSGQEPDAFIGAAVRLSIGELLARADALRLVKVGEALVKKLPIFEARGLHRAFDLLTERARSDHVPKKEYVEGMYLKGDKDEILDDEALKAPPLSLSTGELRNLRMALHELRSQHVGGVDFEQEILSVDAEEIACVTIIQPPDVKPLRGGVKMAAYANLKDVRLMDAVVKEDRDLAFETLARDPLDDPKEEVDPKLHKDDEDDGGGGGGFLGALMSGVSKTLAIKRHNATGPLGKGKKGILEDLRVSLLERERLVKAHQKPYKRKLRDDERWRKKKAKMKPLLGPDGLPLPDEDDPFAHLNDDKKAKAEAAHAEHEKHKHDKHAQKHEQKEDDEAKDADTAKEGDGKDGKEGKKKKKDKSKKEGDAKDKGAEKEGAKDGKEEKEEKEGKEGKRKDKKDKSKKDGDKGAEKDAKGKKEEKDETKGNAGAEEKKDDEAAKEGKDAGKEGGAAASEGKEGDGEGDKDGKSEEKPEGLLMSPADRKAEVDAAAAAKKAKKKPPPTPNEFEPKIPEAPFAVACRRLETIEEGRALARRVLRSETDRLRGAWREKAGLEPKEEVTKEIVKQFGEEPRKVSG